MDALTNTSTWARNEYLGKEYFTADIQFIEKPGNVVGFSNGRFAFCDPKEAYQDSISAFQAYKYPCGPYADVMSFLNQMIKHFNVSQDVYCKNFGVVRNRLHEAAHVEDHIFIRDNNPKVAGQCAELLLSKDSFLFDTLAGLRDKPVHYNNTGTDVREISALIRGLEKEVNYHIEEGQPGLAIIAYADFLLFQGIAKDMYLERAPGSRICEWVVLIMISDQLGCSSESEDILRSTLKELPTDKAALAIQKTLSEVSAKNFKSLDQRW